MSAEQPIPRVARREDCPTSLYRHFAADGALLYVGVSLSWPARTKTHAKGSRWFEQVSRVEIERFHNRDDALAAEREAIKRERPKFNVIHNQVRPQAPSHRSTMATKWRSSETRSEMIPQIGDDMSQLLKQLMYRGPRPIGGILGPHALVGPALVYRESKVSMFVVWGSFDTPGELTELVMGDLVEEAPNWTEACASVRMIMPAGSLTMIEAREIRACLIRNLSWDLEKVETFDTDLSFAMAYATQFPSAKSRQILDDVAKEARR